LTEDAATSALLLRISARQLGGFAGSVISHFEGGRMTLPDSDPRDAKAIAHILQNRILVAKHLFRDSNNRRAIVKIVTRLFLSPSASEYAGSLMDSWRMDDAWVADIRHELHEIVTIPINSLPADKLSILKVNTERPTEMTRLVSAIYGGCNGEVRVALASSVLPSLFKVKSYAITV